MAKVKRKRENVGYHIINTSRRPLYLLRSPISVLPTNQLPTNGTVLRHYQYLISARSKRFKSTKENFSCRKGKGNDMVCKTESNCEQEKGQKCLLRKIVQIWESCGFGNYLISDSCIVKKFETIHIQWRQMVQSKTLQWKTDTKDKKIDEFRSLMEGLFDIGKFNIDDFIRSSKDMPRDSQAIEEDLAFIADQKSDRMYFISSSEDEELERRIQRRQERYSRYEAYRAKLVASGECEPLHEGKIDEMEPTESQSQVGLDNSFNQTTDDEDYEPIPKRIRTLSDSGTDNLSLRAGTPQESSHYENLSLAAKEKHSSGPVTQVHKEISRDGLIEATTPLSVRAGISYRDQTMFIAAVVNYLGADLRQLQVNRETVRTKRYEIVRRQGDEIRKHYREEMSGKNLVLHFDSKIVAHIEETMKQKVTRDRIAVSVTSPEFGHKEDLLLGVVPTYSGKAADQALVIQNLVEHFELPDQIFAICTDTTATNTGRKEGAVMILTRVLQKPLLWLMCRHHIYEIHMAHAYKAITRQESQAPGKTLYLNFKKRWEEFLPFLSGPEAVTKYKKFDESTLIHGTGMYELYNDAKTFVTDALENQTFPRDDYKHLVEYLAFYLNVESDKLKDFKIYQPGACHEARFMADSLYHLTLEITSPVLKFIPEDRKETLSKTCVLIGLCYAPWFLKSSLADHAVLNDFSAFKAARIISKEWDWDVGNSLVKSLTAHSWYLSPKAVVMALADSHLMREQKIEILQTLMKFEVPAMEEINISKPIPVTIDETTRLKDLVTQESWFLFLVKDLVVEVRDWVGSAEKGENFETIESFGVFTEFIKNLSVTNDCAERNIGVIQQFIGSSHNEQQRQDVLLVVRENRKLVTKNMAQKELEKL